MKPFIPVRRRSLAIDMTPLLDVMFMLLLFFVLTSVFVDPAVSVDLPESREEQEPALADIVITVTAEGEISLNGDSVDLPGLEQFLSSSMGRNSSPGVAIRGDSESAYGLVFSVIDLVKRSGIEKIHLSYRRKEESTGDGS
jgi:biopolymer transport protein ExbD